MTEPSEKALCYDIVGNLSRVLAKMLLLDLIKMDKGTRSGLTKAISEQGKQIANQGDADCLLTRVKENISITFVHDDLALWKSKHIRPLYYTRYIQEQRSVLRSLF